MTGHDGRFVLEQAREFDAPAEQIFGLLTHPTKLAKWWGPHGFTTPEIHIDLRAGGSLRFTMQPPDGEPFHLSGEFLQIDVPSRLGFTFRYEDNFVRVGTAVLCLDHGDTTPTGQVPATFARFEKASPTFGRAFAFQAALCSTWPTRASTGTASRGRGLCRGPGSAACRAHGSPRYAWAKSLAKELDSGVLVARRGDGPGAYAQRNLCIDDAVDRYLIDGHVPRGNSCASRAHHQAVASFTVGGMVGRA